MRHRLTTRFVFVLTAALVLAVVAWAGLARTVTDADEDPPVEASAAAEHRPSQLRGGGAWTWS